MPSGDSDFSVNPGTMEANYCVIECIDAGEMGEVCLDTLFDA